MSPRPPRCISVVPSPAAVLRHPPTHTKTWKIPDCLWESGAVWSPGDTALPSAPVGCSLRAGSRCRRMARAPLHEEALAGTPVSSGASQAHLSTPCGKGTLLPSGSEHSCEGARLSPRKFPHIPEWGASHEHETPPPEYIRHSCMLSVCGM